MVELNERTENRPGESPILVRRMRTSDIEQVSRIERTAFSTAWSVQAYVTELANPNATYLVAVDGRTGLTENIVGYAGLWVVMDEAHVTTIAVKPECRGRRIGERMLSEMLFLARRQGANRATLEVRSSNVVAHRLYEKYGFLWVAVRKNYYSDNNENADILWINDMDDPAWRKRYNELRRELELPPM
ncbi:MAG: ribosomal protein S18-alanine N-acetyltransferase [Capsulimonadales bacterium]|nr:ribosomal protein S18-alanine N-acetyltransferase [Capsulimonadales bacterium]